MGTKPPDAMICSGQCHGFDDATADRIVRDFTPESRRIYLDTAPARHWPTNVSCVATTRDAEFPLDLQRRYAAELGATLTTMPAGHLPMLQEHATLAAVICPRAS